MSDMDSRKGIELFVDQQVFMDVVHGNEDVEELGAASEITTFEQRGDELFLEGNLLFTAFLEGAPPSIPVATDALEQKPRTEHVMHRMPFDLAVPVYAQVPGLLSVQVLVPDATMEILGPGWIHIRAMVQIEGLSPDGGYTVHCGAQEAIIPGLPSHKEPPVSANAKPSTEFDQNFEPVDPFAGIKSSLYSQTPSGAQAEEPLEFDELLKPLVENEPMVENLAGQGGTSGDEGSLTSPGWKMQLAEADRALNGGAALEKATPASPLAKASSNSKTSGMNSPFATSPFQASKVAEESVSASFAQERPSSTVQPASQRASSTQPVTRRESSTHVPEPMPSPSTPGMESVSGIHAESPLSMRDQTQGEPEKESAYAEFHFEQVDLGREERESSGPTQGGLQKEPDESAKEPAGVRSEWSDVFLQPLSEEVAPHLDVNLDMASYKATTKSETQTVDVVIEEPLPTDKSAPHMKYTPVGETPVTLSTKEWFWKTMSIPAGESQYTMKFRITQSSETIEEIAHFYNLSVTELIRANPNTTEPLDEGQLLYIPVN